MTVTLPDQDTDTARQILERAELTPTCERPTGCDREAEWILHMTNRPCGCRMHLLACTPCKERVLAGCRDAEPHQVSCRGCGAIGTCSTGNPAFEASAEPLR